MISYGWLLRRCLMMCGFTMVVNGVVAFLTYTEEDEPHESGDPCNPLTGDRAGWREVLPLSPW